MINSEDDINGCLVAPELNTNGTICLRLLARKKVNGVNMYRGLKVGVKADGSTYTELDNSQNDNSIVTTTSHGSNYVRFGNGLQICWGFTGGNEQLITFPQPFKNRNYTITVTGINNKNEAYATVIRDETKTSTGVRIYCAYLDKTYIAMGYWN